MTKVDLETDSLKAQCIVIGRSGGTLLSKQMIGLFVFLVRFSLLQIKSVKDSDVLRSNPLK